MTYLLHFESALWPKLTLFGEKEVQDDLGPDAWADTSSLRTVLLEGHVRQGEERGAAVLAAGELNISLNAFLKQLTTVRVDAVSTSEKARALQAFLRFFVGNLWEVYRPKLTCPTHQPPPRAIPLFTHEGVRDAEITEHSITTADQIGLRMTRFRRSACDDLVLIIHGLTTSSDMFIMPEHYNLVSFLLDNGYEDVWTVDYRMSNRLPYNQQRHRFTMDEIALFDFPPAIDQIRRAAGEGRRIHVICHCLGSVSFCMSLFGGAVSGIRSVVANSAALTPRVPAWSAVKLTLAPFIVEYLLGLSYLDPGFSAQPGVTVGKLVGKLASFFHRECDVPACHMLSLMWGAGHPALYSHENLCEETHRRGGDLYGPTSMHYYRHVRKMVRSANTAVKYDETDRRLHKLPTNYFERVADVTTPVLFMTGEKNRVFTDSNVVCFERLEKLVPGRHQLEVVPGYGHQDVFMGVHVAADVFPRILRFLRANSA